jgi:hypothetical protein
MFTRRLLAALLVTATAAAPAFAFDGGGGTDKTKADSAKAPPAVAKSIEPAKSKGALGKTPLAPQVKNSGQKGKPVPHRTWRNGHTGWTRRGYSGKATIRKVPYVSVTPKRGMPSRFDKTAVHSPLKANAKSKGLAKQPISRFNAPRSSGFHSGINRDTVDMHAVKAKTTVQQAAVKKPQQVH